MKETNSAKEYNQQKIVLALLDTIVVFVFLCGVFFSGFSFWLSQSIKSVLSDISNDTLEQYVQFFIFIMSLGVLETLISFPLSFYSGYILEHTYQLSNQTFMRWLGEEIKGLLVAFVISFPLLWAFYFCLVTFNTFWWLPISIFLFFFSVVLGRLAPIFILPLFYKLKPIKNSELSRRLIRLCQQVGISVLGIFEFNLSKNTKKANAAFTGIGKSKRIILGDTLLEQFTPEEIEVVFAHELGHQKLGHIWQLLIFGAVVQFGMLYVIAQCYDYLLIKYGLQHVSDLPALPLLAIIALPLGFLIMPVQNLFSRKLEYQADVYALRLTKKNQEFITAMEKLGNINLADPQPHPLIEFLFYSHPALKKRIAQALR